MTLADIPECTCGTFVVGRCLDCGELRCGYCSTMVEGRRRCWQHIRDDQARQATELDAANERLGIQPPSLPAKLLATGFTEVQIAGGRRLHAGFDELKYVEQVAVLRSGNLL